MDAGESELEEILSATTGGLAGGGGGGGASHHSTFFASPKPSLRVNTDRLASGKIAGGGGAASIRILDASGNVALVQRGGDDDDDDECEDGCRSGAEDDFLDDGDDGMARHVEGDEGSDEEDGGARPIIFNKQPLLSSTSAGFPSSSFTTPPPAHAGTNPRSPHSSTKGSSGEFGTMSAGSVAIRIGTSARNTGTTFSASASPRSSTDLEGTGTPPPDGPAHAASTLVTPGLSTTGVFFSSSARGAVKNKRLHSSGGSGDFSSPSGQRMLGLGGHGSGTSSPTPLNGSGSSFTAHRNQQQQKRGGYSGAGSLIISTTSQHGGPGQGIMGPNSAGFMRSPQQQKRRTSSDAMVTSNITPRAGGRPWAGSSSDMDQMAASTARGVTGGPQGAPSTARGGGGGGGGGLDAPPQTAAGAGETARGSSSRPVHSSRIHVVRIKEKDSNASSGGLTGKAGPGGSRTRTGGGGNGNYKMPHNPFYKNQNQVARERAAAAAGRITALREEDDGSAAAEEELAEIAAAKTLGDTPWHAHMHIPVYRADGELDARYVARHARHRQKVVLKSFIIYICMFVALAGPYAMYSTQASQEVKEQAWKVQTSSALVPLLMRLAAAGVMLLLVLFIRRRHRRDARGYSQYITSGLGSDAFTLGIGGAASAPPYPFFPTDVAAGWAVSFSGVVLMCAEGVRDRRWVETSLLVQDGLMLQLTLLYAFLFAVLRSPRIHALVQAAILFLTYNLAFLFVTPPSGSHSVNYMLKCDAYQVLLLVALGIYHFQVEELSNKMAATQKSMYAERRKADQLLRSMLPGTVYTSVLEGRDPYLSGIATIGFCNVELTHGEGYTPQPAELMQRLHDSFKRIDGIVSVYRARGVHKIETVSKTYLLCCGLLEEIEDHAASMVDVCLEIMHMIQGRNAAARGGKGGSTALKLSSGLKIGIATGPVVGGIIGTQRKFFRVFGDTVNVSARMCTSCRTWEIQANKYAYESLNELQRAQYQAPEVRVLDIKGKGSMETYLITRRDDWVPRYSKAVMNRGREEGGPGSNGLHGDHDSDHPGSDGSSSRSGVGTQGPSFVFHKIVRQTHLRRFPLLQFTSSYEHHDPELLKSEGPSSTTSQHLEYKFQINQFNLWWPRTQWNIGWFFLWLVGCFGVIASEGARNKAQRENDELVREGMQAIAPVPRLFNGFTDSSSSSSSSSASSSSVGSSATFLGLAISILFISMVYVVASLSFRSKNFYKKHTQIHTAAYGAGIGVWILAVLWEWGLNDGPIAPHFAFILLNLYIALFLRLQLRFLLPLVASELFLFLALMLLKRMNPFDILFSLSYLLLLAGFLLYASWKGENRRRANYLVQYALDMEQGQMDGFLKNLLPQFVVNVLKKQSVAAGGGGENASGAKGTTGGPAGAGVVTKRGSVVADPTGFGGAASEDSYSRGSRSLNSPSAITAGAGGGDGSTTGRRAAGGLHTRRRSVFDVAPDGLASSSGSGGLASRFAMNFPNATVFESDIVGYTKLVSNWPAQRTLNMLNELFTLFDNVCASCLGVEKIETIGDAFMCVVFEDEPDGVLNFALDVLAGLADMNRKQRSEEQNPIEIRSGVCTGPCYGGVIGSDVPRFHVFGPAHDGSILLEQNGRAGTAMVSAPTYAQACARYTFEPRPDIALLCEGMSDGVFQLIGHAAGKPEREKEIFRQTSATESPSVPTRSAWV